MSENVIRTLFNSSQLYSVEMAMRLKESHQIDPVYWLTNGTIEQSVKEAFPHSICHDQISSYKGMPSRDIDPPPALDLSIIDRLSDYEHTVLTMLDRNDSNSGSFSYSDRVSFYYDLVRYWSFVVSELKLDLVVFEEEPHQVSDYVLFLVARDSQVTTYMTVRTIGDFGLIPMSDFEIGSETLRNLYLEKRANPTPIDLPDSVQQYLGKLRGSYDEVLAEHLWDQVDRVKTLRKPARIDVLDDLRFFVRKASASNSLFKRLRFFAGLEVPPSDQKQAGKPLSESKMTYWAMTYYKFATYIKKKRNKQYYDLSVTEPLDLDVPFIFCGLQYQPEKSTCPLAGRFVDQILMCEQLAETLPLGWKLYVKEHPSQFVPDYTRYGERFRSQRYYDRLKENPRIELVPLNVDTFALIDSSKAVASATGTLCWEAVVRQKPAICFGHAWFRDCEGVFSVHGVSDLRLVMKNVLDGYSVDYSAVEAYVDCLIKVTGMAAVGGPSQLEHFSLDVSQNAAAHADMLGDFLSPKHG